MTIQACPRCRTRVMIGSDGICPSCRRKVVPEAASPGGPTDGGTDDASPWSFLEQQDSRSAASDTELSEGASPFAETGAFAAGSGGKFASETAPPKGSDPFPPGGTGGSDNPYSAPAFSPQADDALNVRPAWKGIGWLLFSFEGRIPRRQYWAGTLGATAAFYLVVFLLILAFGEESEASSLGTLIAYIPMIWVSLAVQVKRWHDVDKSGWWVLINFLPCIGGLWAFIENGCLRGTQGPNRYGPDPT